MLKACCPEKDQYYRKKFVADKQWSYRSCYKIVGHLSCSANYCILVVFHNISCQDYSQIVTLILTNTWNIKIEINQREWKHTNESWSEWLSSKYIQITILFSMDSIKKSGQ